MFPMPTLPRDRHLRRRQAMTLVELLVVIAIIGLLLGLLLPAIQRVREAMNRMRCGSNLRQIGIALHHFHNDYGRFPPGYLYAFSPQGNALGHGWAAHLLPYIEQDALHRQINWQAPIWDNSNTAARMQHLRIYLCPTDGRSANQYVEMGSEQYAMACYVASFGPGDMDDNPEDDRGVFFRNSQTRMADILDGTSNTLFVGERINGPFLSPHSHGVHVYYETTWIGAVREITDPEDDHAHMVLFQTGHLPNAPDSDDRDVVAAHRQGA
ncbi:hypothetical protein HRbin36_00124 [bacterium HR36]|nr:hypothetical protein HRbin36_00124 [bacterium HR36]